MVLLVFVSMLFSYIQVTNSRCSCATTSSSQDVISNYVLMNHLIIKLKVDDVSQCFHSCIYGNHGQCKSFNFGRSIDGLTCELNSSDKNLDLKSLIMSSGWSYYEVTEREPFNEAVSSKEPSCVKCQDGFTGKQCKTKAFSCQDYFRYKNTYISGIYSVFDANDNLFPVYCDMDKSRLSAWTAVLSYALKFNNLYKDYPFFKDNPINQSAPNWTKYRLSLARMSSIRGSSIQWRVTCSYGRYADSKRDHAIARWSDIDLMTLNRKVGCQRFVYIDVRGFSCRNCTTWVSQGPGMFSVGVPYGAINGCSLKAADHSQLFDKSFGYYEQYNADFRCTENTHSTTQFWFGGKVN